MKTSCQLRSEIESKVEVTAKEVVETSLEIIEKAIEDGWKQFSQEERISIPEEFKKNFMEILEKQEVSKAAAEFREKKC